MRLTLLGGFLGSGKTTWLRHQFHQALLADAHVIVNEAAATPVDDALLKGMSSIEVLSGGCACCERGTSLSRVWCDYVICAVALRRAKRGSSASCLKRAVW